MMTDVRSGRVVRTHSGFIDVETTDGIRRCRLRGRLKKERRGSDLCVVGDVVDVHVLDDETGVVEHVHPRRTRLSRRHPGPAGRWREDVLVANLDQAVCVFCFGAPQFNPRLLDRYLVVAEHNGLQALVVANKLDQLQDERAREPFAAYARLGYTVVYTSAEDGRGIEPLRRHLGGRISAFSGPSGGGKSRLINALQPELQLRVGGISESVHKGKHTTRVASLHPLRDGGYVADTPGIRELGTWRIPAPELARCFLEFRPYIDACTFGDCLHVQEPGCAVRTAHDGGAISAERYASYLRILFEEERDGSSRAAR